MNDDFGFCGFVKNDVRVGRCRQTADSGIICAHADVRVKQEKVDNSLNAGLNALQRPSRDHRPWDVISFP